MTKLRAYVWFCSIAVGETFGDNGQWIKRSSRTAWHKEAQRVFYFRQKDLVCTAS